MSLCLLISECISCLNQWFIVKKGYTPYCHGCLTRSWPEIRFSLCAFSCCPPFSACCAQDQNVKNQNDPSRVSPMSDIIRAPTPGRNYLKSPWNRFFFRQSLKSNCVTIAACLPAHQLQLQVITSTSYPPAPAQQR